MPEWIGRYWTEWVFGLLIAALTCAVKRLGTRLRREHAENRALRDGICSLLRSRIVECCERAARDGWCGARLRDTVLDLYGSYHALGGNGTVTSMVEQIMGLPAVQERGGQS